MAPNVVLVTGVADRIAGRLAAELAADESIERVIGVDPNPPATGLPERVELVAADPRGPLVTRVLRSAGVDTVVHAAPLTGPGQVVGTMRLLAGCQRAGGVRKLVVRSTAEVYGASATSPAVFTEQDVPDGVRRDALEVESHVRGFARRHPEATVTTVRLAELLGSGADSPLARYLALPVVPTALGFDARVQVLHPGDAVAVLRRAVTHDLPGVYNAGGDGVLLLSQAIRRAGRVQLPMPRAAVPAAARLARAELSPDLARLLNYGRVLDTTRLKTAFGYAPRWSTTAAFDDYVHGQRR
ncbi:NAD-dependent epimerase/dehydratase family protein [Actinophytocola gossypii]|uniref:NAD-dependent epimerase/dehydratase family protein n=1 Tax=Actinophytocola gossypii TaxID=2812003 RepID=A0ABT2JCS7_9PSEU|nr:NAD-dependent epimerase/dehydratase family protein [Actinophytocola gossypii]MCT2585674.1 NAD-dependent epimerase/dehydratase family protein [Actinophytocola gossypii]